MHQKDLVRQAWEQAGLYRTKDAKLRQFLAYFDQATGDCWPELSAELRDRYPEYLETVTRPLWATGDKLLRLNLLRLVRLDDRKERVLLDEVIAASNPRTDEVELRTAVLLGDAALNKQVAAKKGLTSAMQTFVARRQAELRTVTPAARPARKPTRKAAGGARPK